jgi:hypothetical protein
MFWLAFYVLATMFLFVGALLIIVGVIVAVAGIFIRLDNFLSGIFESPREFRPWRLHQEAGRPRESTANLIYAATRLASTHRRR